MKILKQNQPDATYSLDEIFRLNLDELDENKKHAFLTLSGCSSALDLSHAKGLKSKIEEIVENFPTMNFTTQLQKLIYTYDYMLKNVRYHIPECGFSSQMFLNEDERNNHVSDAYGALVNGKALCAGMAEAIVLILKHPRFNIKANVVSGKNCGIPHAFVRTELGSNNVYIDAAAELKFDPNTQVENFKSDYFLVSSSKLIKKGYDFERSSKIVGSLKIYTDGEDYDRGMIKSAYEKLNNRIKIIRVNNHNTDRSNNLIER